MTKKKLLCEICGRKIGMPSCCGTSMIFKGDYLLCCCSKECNHKPISICCGQKMVIIDVE